MKVILIAGLPGSGKTHLRKEKYAKLPYLDMAELRQQTESKAYDGWREAMHMLFNQLYNEQGMGTREIVVEGIFEPNTASLKWLEGYCQDHKIELEIVRVTTPFANALVRMVEDYRVDHDEERLKGRVFLAAKYAGGF